MNRFEWSTQLSQLSGNARLRMGLLSIVGILWVYGLLLMADQADAWRVSSKGLREELSRVLPLSKERGWPERADDARQQLTAIRGMLWAESDLGLVEAKFQDWLRNTALKTGLSVRELSVTRSTPATTLASGDVPQGVKARLLADFNRLSLLGFLVEVGRSERVIVIERFALRLSSQPSLAEIDLRILGAAQAVQESKP